MDILRRRFDAELETLRGQLLEMGAATEEMVRDAVTSLVGQDRALAGGIPVRDDAVDDMESAIEARCLRLLTLQQPVFASDLRLISTTLKVIGDIERIGDHAVNIARVALRIAEEMVAYQPLVDIPRLGERARAMLHDTLQAFVHHDVDRARAAIEADEEIDTLYRGMREDLQEAMRQDPTCVGPASHLLFVIHYLERIGDHCTNIAERIIVLETGRPTAG